MCDELDHDHEHPKDRPLAENDPMFLSGNQLDGDPELMMHCLVEEFARLGYDADGIESLFHDPNYQATAGLTQLFGADGVRERIERILARCGTLRVRVIECDDIEDRAVAVELTLGGRPLTLALARRERE